jgi:hypothetical protein
MPLRKLNDPVSNASALDRPGTAGGEIQGVPLWLLRELIGDRPENVEERQAEILVQKRPRRVLCRLCIGDEG